MTDTRFKWIVCASAITIIAVTAIIRLSGKEAPAQPKETTCGEYVYLDEYSTIHADRKCKRLNYKGMYSDRIRKDQIPLSDRTFCPNCISDETYRQLTENNPN